jgi:hypothetical protein
MDVLAKTFLNQRCMIVNSNIVKFAEIEIYCYDSNNHPDIFVHQDPHQALYSTWYFHRFKNGSYKGGTFKGLDLTLGGIGSHGTVLYFGILIRSIIVKGVLIEGPCNCVDKILSMYGVGSIQTFTGGEVLSALENKHGFILTECPDSQSVIYSGPRIGLSEVKDPTKKWVNLPYRFTSDRRVKKKKTSLMKI